MAFETFRFEFVSLLFVGDTERWVYVNTTHALQELQDNIHRQIIYTSKQELHCVSRSSLDVAMSAYSWRLSNWDSFIK
jgi:hypothetical protein